MMWYVWTIVCFGGEVNVVGIGADTDTIASLISQMMDMTWRECDFANID
ncbi:hypothetical protein GLV88_03725 [Staphylococcus hyicus]|nr:hypothetical protein [Staphylococcus hyicus]